MAEMQTVVQILLNELDRIMGIFRPAFSRESSYLHFLELLLALMLREDTAGVTSCVRYIHGVRGGNPDLLYDALDKFFKAESVDLEKMREIWRKHVIGDVYAEMVALAGRLIIIYDGVKVPKSGRYMPAVARYHQESGSMTKPESFWGHFFGAIGVLIGDGDHCFYCPVNTDIEDGDEIIRKMEDAEYRPESHVVRMTKETIIIFKDSKRSVFAVMDRYFLSTECVELIKQANEECKGRRLDIITKGKRSIVAYERPGERPPGKGGRPAKKGASVKLKTLFEEKADEFKELKVNIYGREETVKYFSIDLLWGKGLYYEMKFILVVMPGGEQSILVCSDTSVSPATMVEGYAIRWKCEQSYKEAKNVIGMYDSHFWTNAMPRLNVYRNKTDVDPVSLVTDLKERKRIVRTMEAHERFSFICCVAQGTLQLLALKAREIGFKTGKWLRRYSSETSSEETMQWDLRRMVLEGFHSDSLPPNMQKILGQTA